MFNFTLEPTETKRIECGSVFVELPVYGDLLGEEYDVLETENNKETAWNQRLLELTEKLAQEKNITLWEISKLLSEAEGADTEVRMQLLGNHVKDFLELLADRPSEAERSYAIVKVVLKRVDPNVRLDQVRKLPRKFIKQVCDFVLAEQIGGVYVPYQELETKLMMLQEEINLLHKVAEEAQEVSKGVKHSKLRAALDDWLKGEESEGKDDTPSM